MSKGELTTIADGCLAKLVEHYDAVLILASRNEDGGTKALVRRAGNFYASKGLAVEWLEEERNKEQASAIVDRIKDLPDKP